MGVRTRAARILVAFMAMIVVLSGCSGKSSVGLWSESLDEMKNGSLSFYMRSVALSVPKGTYDYIDVIKEIEENEDWSVNMIFAQAMDDTYRLLFIYGDVARIQAEKINRNEVKLYFDGEISAYESVGGQPWHKTDEADEAYKKVLMSTVNVIDMDGSMIRRKASDSLVNIFTAQFKEAIQSFRNRLLYGVYAQGNYNALKSFSGWLFYGIFFVIGILLLISHSKIYRNLVNQATARFVMAAIFSCVAGVVICMNANAIAFRWSTWLFECSTLLALAFFIASFFVKDNRLLSGLECLIALIGGFAISVLLVTHAVICLVVATVAFVAWCIKPEEGNKGEGNKGKEAKADSPIPVSTQEGKKSEGAKAGSHIPANSEEGNKGVWVKKGNPIPASSEEGNKGKVAKTGSPITAGSEAVDKKEGAKADNPILASSEEGNKGAIPSNPITADSEEGNKGKVAITAIPIPSGSEAVDEEKAAKSVDPIPYGLEVRDTYKGPKTGPPITVGLEVLDMGKGKGKNSESDNDKTTD